MVRGWKVVRLRFRSVVSREYSEWTAVVGTGRRSVNESRSGDAVETRGDRVKEFRKSCTLNAVDVEIEVDASTEDVVATAIEAEGCFWCTESAGPRTFVLLECVRSTSEVTGSEMNALETAGFAVVIGTVRDAAASRIVSSSPPEFISCNRMISLASQ